MDAEQIFTVLTVIQVRLLLYQCVPHSTIIMQYRALISWSTRKAHSYSEITYIPRVEIPVNDCYIIMQLLITAAGLLSVLVQW